MRRGMRPNTQAEYVKLIRGRGAWTKQQINGLAKHLNNRRFINESDPEGKARVEAVRDLFYEKNRSYPITIEQTEQGI